MQYFFLECIFTSHLNQQVHNTCKALYILRFGILHLCFCTFEQTFAATCKRNLNQANSPILVQFFFYDPIILRLNGSIILIAITSEYFFGPAHYKTPICHLCFCNFELVSTNFCGNPYYSFKRHLKFQQLRLLIKPTPVF